MFVYPEDPWPQSLSQRSLQDAPIFRLLLKVAVKGTHQCDFTNFWGSFGLPTVRASCVRERVAIQGVLLLVAPCAQPG
jgi:hypothetical protein